MIREAGILLLLLSAAVYTDYRNYTIPNPLIAAGIVTGLTGRLILFSFGGIRSGLLGLCLPLPLILLQHLRMIGAGDIKLMMVTGSFLGPAANGWVLFLSFLTGAVISLSRLIKQRMLLIRFRYFSNYIKTCINAGKTLPYCDPQALPECEKVHFSLCIFVGTAMVMIRCGGGMPA